MKFTEEQKAKRRQHYKDHRARIRLSQKTYNNTSKAKKTRISKDLQNKYGITLSQYNEMLESQYGKCAICKNPERVIDKHGNTRRLAVDHCHRTNKVRGLLCQACNTGLGMFKDNPLFLRSAIIYVETKS